MPPWVTAETFVSLVPVRLLCPQAVLCLEDRWFARHLAVGSLFDLSRLKALVNMLQTFSPLWPASCLHAVDNFRNSAFQEVRDVWDLCDDCLVSMSS